MGKKTSVILGGTTLATTIFLFFYLVNEEDRSSLFYLNLFNSILVTLVFFGTFFVISLKAENETGVVKHMISLNAGIYITIILGVMILYNLVLRHFLSLEFYWVPELILTVLFAVVWTFSTKVATTDSKERQGLRGNQTNLHALAAKIMQQEQMYFSLLQKFLEGPELEKHRDSKLKLVVRKIENFPPSITRNTNSIQVINDVITSVTNLVEEGRKNESLDQSFVTEMDNCSEQGLIRLNSISITS